MGNASFKEFSTAFKSHQNFISVLLDYVCSISVRKSKNEQAPKACGKEKEYACFVDYVRKLEFNRLEQCVWVIDGRKEVFRASIDQNHDYKDTEAIGDIDQDYQTYIARLRQKWNDISNFL